VIGNAPRLATPSGFGEQLIQGLAIKISRVSLRSAEGAQYDSQGQAPSNARRVAPGQLNNLIRALKVRNTNARYFALSELNAYLCSYPGATRLALLGACPWLLYCAPSALEAKGDAPRVARRLPLAIILRAFGARIQGRRASRCSALAPGC